MTNKNEQRKVPELRFPEFSGEWEEISLGEVSDVTKLAGFEFTNHVVYQSEGNIIALRGLNVKNGKLDLENVKYIDNSNLDKIKRSKLYIEDIIFTYVGTIGETAIINENDKFYLAPNVCRIRCSKAINPIFLKQQISTKKYYRKIILPLIATSSQPALSMENIRKFNVSFPNIEEQQKIGEFFSKLDRQIELEEKKLALLEEQKKGYMQKIFSQELRFKDENGEEYPEWEKKKLSEVAEYSNGLAHEEYVNESGNFTLINSKFISTDGKTKKEVTKSLLTANEGDIAMVLSDLPNGKALGKCYFVMEDKKYAINQRIALLKVKKGNSFFIYQILNRNKKLLRYDNGVSQTNLRKDNVLNLTINIPVISEQNKIAKIFSTFNERISYQQNKINYLIKNKKYLINKMLV